MILVGFLANLLSLCKFPLALLSTADFDDHVYIVEVLHPLKECADYNRCMGNKRIRGLGTWAFAEKANNTAIIFTVLGMILSLVSFVVAFLHSR